MSERWIIIPNWERYQHPDIVRSDKAPPWIKLHTQILDDDDFMELPIPTQAIYLKMLVAFAKGRRRLLGDTAALSRNLGQRVTDRQLKLLSDAGFIEFSASKPQAGRLHPASLDKRREEQPPYPLQRGTDSEDEQDELETLLAKATKQPPKTNGTRSKRDARREIIRVLGSYPTGCLHVRGQFGESDIEDALGPDPTPKWWTKPKPTEEEVVHEMKERGLWEV